MGHRHAVGLHQQIVEQVGLEVELEETGEGALAAAMLQPFLDTGKDQPPVRVRRPLRAQQGGQSLGEVGLPAQVPFGEREPAGLRESLGEPQRVLAVAGLGQEVQGRARHRERPGRDPLGDGAAVQAKVAREHLVAAVAAERHRHLSARQLGEQVHGNGGRVAEGPVVVPDEAIDQVEGLGLDHELGVVGAEVLRHHPRVRRLVVLGVPRKADGECADAPPGSASHARHDTRRVEAAREEGPERNVRHQPSLDRLLEQGAQALLRLAVVADGAIAEPQPPVGHRALGPLLGRDEVVGGRQRTDLTIERARRGHIAVGQVEGQGRRVPLAGHRRVREQRLHLRGEREQARPVVVVERLLAGTVAGDQEALPPRVPEREREHPVERFHDLVLALLVEVKDHLPVALAREAMAVLQLLAQLAEVVDLAVEDQPERSVFVRHRLAGRVAQVDDGEAPVAEARGPVQMQALPVGPTVGQGGGHGSDVLAPHRAAAREHSAHAAHRSRIAQAVRRAGLTASIP